MRQLRLLMTLLIFLFAQQCIAQNDSTSRLIQQLPDKFISQTSDKISSIDKKLSRQTLKTLKKFARQEEKLNRNLSSKDSNAAKEIFANSKKKIEQLQNEFESIPDKSVTKLKGAYDAYIDTLQSSYKFLREEIDPLAAKSKSLQVQLKAATSKLNVLQGKMQKAEEIKKYLNDRKKYLKQSLEKFGMVKELKKMEKAGYYYAQYITEYRTILKDRKKLEQKAMSILYSTKNFKKFAMENSSLTALFRLPNSNMSASNALSTSQTTSAIVQTRATVQQLMQTNISVGGPSALSNVRQQIQAGQAELNKLKGKIAQYGTTDGEIPSFKPNDQKTRSFLKRLEYGANIQFGKANNFLPASSELALTLGYKLNDKSSLGISTSYSLGLGKSWNSINFSNNGVGLRSYIDWKIKGNFYLSGGYEQNYFSQFKNIDQLRNYSSWKSSGLVGLSKKTTIKGSKSVKLQVQFDFLCYKTKPVTQPFIFRTGFNLR